VGVPSLDTCCYNIGSLLMHFFAIARFVVLDTVSFPLLFIYFYILGLNSAASAVPRFTPAGESDSSARIPR